MTVTHQSTRRRPWLLSFPPDQIRDDIDRLFNLHRIDPTTRAN
jgi:hypothetical protein